jgi:hypothetical protein
MLLLYLVHDEQEDQQDNRSKTPQPSAGSIAAAPNSLQVITFSLGGEFVKVVIVQRLESIVAGNVDQNSDRLVRAIIRAAVANTKKVN